MKRYIIVIEKSPLSLRTIVNQKLEDGYELAPGSLVVYKTGPVLFFAREMISPEGMEVYEAPSDTIAE